MEDTTGQVKLLKLYKNVNYLLTHIGCIVEVCEFKQTFLHKVGVGKKLETLFFSSAS